MSKPIKLIPHEERSYPFATPWVRVGRQSDVFRITFRIPGDTSAILLPEKTLLPHTKVAPERRADRLWEHTCFEMFLRSPDESGYFEFNFSPSQEWAAYRFDGYRDGMRNADVPVPAVIATAAENRFELSARIEVPAWGDRSCEVALSAIIEETDGTKSHWALAHPPEGPPDFHHPAGFSLVLPPSPRT